MFIKINIPNRLLISAKIFTTLIFIQFLYRILFFILFYNQMKLLQLDYILNSFFIGFRFDLRLAVLIILPFLLLSWIFKDSKVSNIFWIFYWTLSFGIIIIIYVFDIAYYSYLNTRLDASILGLSKNLYISIKMIWETYSVFSIILLVIALKLLLYKKIQKIQLFRSEIKLNASKKYIMILLSVIICLGIGYGKWSRYPLRWSDAFYSNNNIANQLAINPLLYFLNTYLWKTESYDIKEIKKYYSLISSEINVIDTNSLALNFNREKVYPDSSVLKANVIIIFLETFPNYKIGFFGNPTDPSPNYDIIANQSIVFNNFYVTKFSTAGSIFSAMTGLPDMATIDKSSTRDPLASRQHILMNDLHDYNKYFFIGGSGNWGDIGGFFRRNVDQIKVFEEGMYKATEVNAWGISDYDLLMEANEILKKEKEPFISVILTAGHHPPFTIPNIENFNKIEFTEEHKENGFSSHKDLNAFRFMDFSLGEFFKSVKKEDYFNNTIFIILGDHGFGHPSKVDLFGSLSLHNFNVPLTIYSPGLNIKHKNIYDIASSIDLMPTLFGLLSHSYKNTGLGKDLFDINNKNDNYAFIFSAANSKYGLISNDYFVMSNFNKEDLVYSFKEKKFINSLNSNIKKMKLLNNGYYEISKYLRYHNE